MLRVLTHVVDSPPFFTAPKIQTRPYSGHRLLFKFTGRFGVVGFENALEVGSGGAAPPLNRE